MYNMKRVTCLIIVADLTALATPSQWWQEGGGAQPAGPPGCPPRPPAPPTWWPARGRRRSRSCSSSTPRPSPSPTSRTTPPSRLKWSCSATSGPPSASSISTSTGKLERSYKNLISFSQSPSWEFPEKVELGICLHTFCLSAKFCIFIMQFAVC